MVSRSPFCRSESTERSRGPYKGQEGRHRSLPYAERNRVAIMLSFQAELRIGEIASLKIGDVVDRGGNGRDQIRLSPPSPSGEARVILA